MFQGFSGVGGQNFFIGHFPVAGGADPDLRLDVGDHSALCSGEPLHLTPLEFSVLIVLMRHVGRLMIHRQLIADD